MRSALVAAALSLAALGTAAATKEPVSFSHNDWELACDNTLTCRAAGYQQESDAGDPVSMLITRKAGPGAALEIEIQTGGEDEVKSPMRFQVGKAAVTGLLGGADSFDDKQIRAVLPELLKSDQATLTAGSKKWTLSLAGLNAVLLKMDEAQGRIGTPGALVRRGSKAESSVLPAVMPPVVNAVRPSKARPGDAALAAGIFPLLKLGDIQEQCNNSEGIDARSLEVYRLSDRQVLLSFSCSMGAYNSSSLLWIANDKPPYAPVSQAAHGGFSPEDASVTSAMKSRGVGDCWSSDTWHFNGKDFVLTGATGDSMCRGFAGGAWSLPRHVSRVVLAKPSSISSKP